VTERVKSKGVLKEEAKVAPNSSQGLHFETLTLEEAEKVNDVIGRNRVEIPRSQSRIDVLFEGVPIMSYRARPLV
jgi:hypothetical protein